MKIQALVMTAALSLVMPAFAQDVAPTGASPQTGQAGKDETSDRTPEKATPTPPAQKDTADGKTSDRSQNKDVKVEHQPGAAGTSGSSMEPGSTSDHSKSK
jgi:hypothetical protein